MSRRVLAGALCTQRHARFLVAIVGYFAIGSYYNYNTYGASGWDVIP